MVHPEQVVADEVEALVIESIGQSILCNIDRQLVTIEFLQDVVDAFGINLPAEVVDRFVTEMDFAGEFEAVVKVVLGGQEVVGALGETEEVFVGKEMREADHERVEERMLVVRLEGMEQVGQADLCLGVDVVDRVVGALVGLGQDLVNTVRHEVAFFLGWPLTGGVGTGDDRRGLIEWDPERDQVIQSGGDKMGVAFEVDGEFFGSDAAFVPEPEWHGPVPECDEGLHLTLTQCQKDITIVVQRLLVELAFDRFDAGPLNREAMSVVVERLGQVEILGVAFVVFAGTTGDVILGIFRFGTQALPVFDVAEFAVSFFGEAFSVFFLPFRPVIVHVAFDLVSGRGSAPQEAFGKFQFGHREQCRFKILDF